MSYFEKLMESLNKEEGKGRNNWNNKNENSGLCVVLFFASDKQSHNSTNLSKEIQTELSKAGFKFKDIVRTKSVLELYFQGFESKNNIVSDAKTLIKNKFSNQATNYDVYATH